MHVNILAVAPQDRREFANFRQVYLPASYLHLDARRRCRRAVPCCASHPGRPIQITKRENEIVVMCEELDGFWHLAGVSSEKQFEAERREASKFFKSK